MDVIVGHQIFKGKVFVSTSPCSGFRWKSVTHYFWNKWNPQARGVARQLWTQGSQDVRWAAVSIAAVQSAATGVAVVFTPSSLPKRDQLSLLSQLPRFSYATALNLLGRSGIIFKSWGCIRNLQRNSGFQGWQWGVVDPWQKQTGSERCMPPYLELATLARVGGRAPRAKQQILIARSSRVLKGGLPATATFGWHRW